VHIPAFIVRIQSTWYIQSIKELLGLLEVLERPNFPNRLQQAHLSQRALDAGA
jgi:hypothetical protein